MLDPTQSTKTLRGFCALCTAHCATIATVLDGKVVRLEADHDHPNGGVFCLKGKAAPELVYHPDRLNHPLKRTRPKSDPDAGWQRISWEQALDEIAHRLLSIRDQFGPRSVALAKGTGGGTSVFLSNENNAMTFLPFPYSSFPFFNLETHPDAQSKITS